MRCDKGVKGWSQVINKESGDHFEEGVAKRDGFEVVQVGQLIGSRD